jgi:ABC-type phosphate transport system substrate-binding protein
MRRLGIILGLGLALARIGVGAATEGSLVVIVHPQRTAALAIDDVRRIYLGGRRFWDDGSTIVAFNLPAGTPVRERFSRRVLHGDSAQLAAYWNERYFHGMFPPAVLSSSDAVKRYVASEPGAIGYIEATEVDSSVRVVLTLE